jgi:hypothetical protein
LPSPMAKIDVNNYASGAVWPSVKYQCFREK